MESKAYNKTVSIVIIKTRCHIIYTYHNECSRLCVLILPLWHYVCSLFLHATISDTSLFFTFDLSTLHQFWCLSPSVISPPSPPPLLLLRRFQLRSFLYGIPIPPLLMMVLAVHPFPYMNFSPDGRRRSRVWRSSTGWIRYFLASFGYEVTGGISTLSLISWLASPLVLCLSPR